MTADPERRALARSPSTGLVEFAVLAAAGLVAGLVTSRVDLAAFGVSFAAAAVAAVALAEQPRLEVLVDTDTERVLEGDVVTMRVTVRSTTAVDRLDLIVAVPPGLTVIDGTNPLRHPSSSRRGAIVRVATEGRPVGPATARRRGPAGSGSNRAWLRWEGEAGRPSTMRVLPGPLALERLVRPARTRVHAGNQISRARGSGSEFADIRPFQPGDRERDVNWRISARRGEPWVNQRHPERNADIVLFLDTFDEVALRDGVRAAAALATGYLDHGDRVGFIGFGGSLRWLFPGGGRRQQYQLVDTLVTTQVYESQAWRDLRVVPRRCLPPSALVVAVSPLVDDRVVAALGDLRSRAVDVALLEVVPPQAPTRTASFGPLAERLWRLERRAVTIPLGPAGRARRHLGRQPAAGRRGRGGDHLSPSRATGSRMTLGPWNPARTASGAAALAVAALLVAGALATGRGEAGGIAIVGLAGLLALGGAVAAGTRRPLAPALALLALAMAGGNGHSVAAVPLQAGALLAVALLAGWSIEERRPVPGEPRVDAGRWSMSAALVLATMAAGRAGGAAVGTILAGSGGPGGWSGGSGEHHGRLVGSWPTSGVMRKGHRPGR